LAIGLINLEQRGLADKFAAHPDPRFSGFKPASLGAFASAAHGPKLAMISGHPILGRWVSPALDSGLRNAIGHNRFAFDRRRHLVEYDLDRSGGRVCTISYAEFLRRTATIVLRAHEANHLVKILYVHLYLGSPHAAPSR
jgi:hypothetical protein